MPHVVPSALYRAGTHQPLRDRWPFRPVRFCPPTRDVGMTAIYRKLRSMQDTGRTDISARKRVGSGVCSGDSFEFLEMIKLPRRGHRGGLLPQTVSPHSTASNHSAHLPAEYGITIIFSKLLYQTHIYIIFKTYSKHIQYNYIVTDPATRTATYRWATESQPIPYRI